MPFLIHNIEAAVNKRDCI